MKSYRVTTEISQNKQLSLDGLPFEEGTKVEVVVSEAKPVPDHQYPLRGSLIKYEMPFATAVDDENWEAAR